MSEFITRAIAVAAGMGGVWIIIYWITGRCPCCWRKVK